jgi:signal transduction histidine kinase
MNAESAQPARLPGGGEQSQAHLFAGILASIQDGIFVLDHDWRFVYLNERAASLALHAIDLTGHNIWEVYPELVGTELWKRYCDVMESRVPDRFEFTGVFPPFSVFAISVYPAGDGISVMWVDITEQMQSIEAMRRYAAQLEEANSALRDFAYIASHDLQEPLRKVRAMGSLLERHAGPALDDKARDYLNRMTAAAGRMQEMLEGLLAYSRVSTKANPFRPVSLDLLAREVLSDLEVRLKRSGGRVVIEPLPTIEADALQMRLLLQNLIGNALKFRHPDTPPLVRLSATRFEREGEAWMELCISDNGVGFDNRYIQKIFQPFVRLHGRSEYEGSGMGLAICQKIAARHGGSIRASGEPGQGAEFRVLLPELQRGQAELIERKPSLGDERQTL